MTGPLPAPGWYQDSLTPGQLRWWDGRQWTPSTQPSPAPSSQQTRGTQRQAVAGSRQSEERLHASGQRLKDAQEALRSRPRWEPVPPDAERGDRVTGMPVPRWVDAQVGRSAPSGWYARHDDDEQYRWWDGTQWTDRDDAALVASLREGKKQAEQTTADREAFLTKLDTLEARRKQIAANGAARIKELTELKATNTAAAMVHQETARKKKRTTRIVMSLIGLTLLGGCYAFFHNAYSKSRQQVDNGSPGAYAACQGFVRDRLKSPSTAHFPLDLATAVTPLGTTFIVKSYVDADNSFGAPIRNNYVCEVTSSDGNWDLISLTGLQ